MGGFRAAVYHHVPSGRITGDQVEATAGTLHS